MKFSIKSVLRFLFPEIQIVDAVKQEGFIAKKAKATATMNTTNNTICWQYRFAKQHCAE